MLVKDEARDETTLAFTPEDEEDATSTLEDVGVRGAGARGALRRRQSGGDLPPGW